MIPTQCEGNPKQYKDVFKLKKLDICADNAWFFDRRGPIKEAFEKINEIIDYLNEK